MHLKKRDYCIYENFFFYKPNGNHMKDLLQNRDTYLKKEQTEKRSMEYHQRQQNESQREKKQ